MGIANLSGGKLEWARAARLIRRDSGMGCREHRVRKHGRGFLRYSITRLASPNQVRAGFAAVGAGYARAVRHSMRQSSRHGIDKHLFIRCRKPVVGMKKRKPNNFVYLLAGLLLLFVLIPVLPLYSESALEVNLTRSLLLAAFTLFTLISVWSLHREGVIFRVGLGLAGLNIVITVSTIYFPLRLIELCAIVLVITFSVLSCFIAGRHVFDLRETDANSLTGAVCVYLLLGLIWALIYEMLAYLWPVGSFQGIPTHGNGIQIDTFLYFSFVTLTTAGYGDITPLNPIIRTLAYLEMITGQFYMAILVSGLVAHFMGQRMSR
jgi:voltage-gated potassium channel